MKRIITYIFTIIISFSVCSCTQYSNDFDLKKDTFNINKVSFDKLNQYLLEQFSNIENSELNFTFSVSEETGEIEKLYSRYWHEYIYLDEDITELFTNVKNSFTYDFSIVSITSTRISYGGEGNEMFVYSLDGKKPKYFWADNKDAAFSSYSLDNNWYYLFLKQR